MIKKIVREPISLKEDIYLLEIIKGMAVTIGHVFRNLFNMNKMPVIDYPNQQKAIPEGYRGMHRLTKRDNGDVRCVACMMCATACPANCIHIIAAEHENHSVEKYPERFDIDLLECVFCGMCVEACPVDAIRMDTGIFSITDYNRRDFVISKEELLAKEPQSESTKKLDIKNPIVDRFY